MSSNDRWTPNQTQESHLENLFVRLNTPQSGRIFVRNAIAEAPSRPVSNRRGNVMIKFMSRKNDRCLELESRSGEFPQAYLLESDPEVVMWLCQAPKETLSIKDEQGRRTGVTGYHLDFLVVRVDKIIAIEVRDERALHDLHVKNPYQFWFDNENDCWHYRAAEEHFAGMGIEFSVVANRAINSVLVNNPRYLEDFMSREPIEEDLPTLKRLQNRLTDVKRLGYLQAINDGFAADQLLYAIAHQDVYVDLHTDRVEHVQTLHLYASREVREVYRLQELKELEPVQPIPGSMFLRPGARVEHGGNEYHVILCSERDVQMRDKNGNFKAFDLKVLQGLFDAQMLKVDGLMASEGPRELAHCSKAQLDAAFKRLEAVNNNDTTQYSRRSLSRFASQIRGVTGHLAQVLALVDDVAGRGNRAPRYSEREEEVIKIAIEEKYNRGEACTKRAAFIHYQGLCGRTDEVSPDQPKLNRVSFTTFSRRVDELKCVRSREGKRVAYQKGPIVSTVYDPYPVHGRTPHEVCYIDHTVLNLATTCPEGMPLQKPTLSIAADGFTTQARALILSYDPPSTTTVLLILRDYVRRNHRLPKVLSLDNAKEFRGNNLKSFCQLYGIHLRFRSPAEPRGGAPIESLIGAVEKEVVSEMTGNTIAMKDPRLVTKSVNGFNHAEHTLLSAYNIIEDYLFVERETRTHPVLGVSPADFERQQLTVTGERAHLYQRYDENLMLATSPFAQRVFHKVCPRRGVWVDNMWYRHAMLRGHRKGFKVRVRIEPFAARVVYVEVKGRWYAAVGTNSRDLDGRTAREIQITLREKLKKAGSNARAEKLTLKEGGASKLSLKPEDFDERLARQQAETKFVLASKCLLGASAPDESTLNGERPFDFARGPALLPELPRSKQMPESEQLLQASPPPASSASAVMQTLAGIKQAAQVPAVQNRPVVSNKGFF